mgnify:CR=1 FL=1
MKEYPVQRAAVLKPKPDPDTLVFGKTFTDHMFIMDYTAGQAGTTGASCPTAPSPWSPPPWCSTMPGGL